jgi:hypothetical protein
MLSSNNDHDNTPWVLPDGRILYMRWEYVDRSQVHFHHLWAMNPDGTGQMVFFGNQVGGIAMLDAKPIPGTRKVVASFSPGHGRPEHLGPVAVVDPGQGPDVPGSARNVSKQSDWKDPYALSEDCFLAANRKGIFVMDGQGNAEPVYSLPERDRAMECNEPRPVESRPREPIIAARTNLAKETGRLILEDVYRGRKMQSVAPGTIKKLLVLQQVPKPVNFSGGMEPLTIGGSFTLAKILGTVPVEPDGSAYMEVPALKSVFFVALDQNDLAVKRMHSFAVIGPGETTSCVGCHETRTEAPVAKPALLKAMRRPPSPIEPIAGVPEVIDFPRDVQPILDRHCVTCHNADGYVENGRLDLSGDKTARYTMSYWAMQDFGLVSDGRNRTESNYEPYKIGSSASRLMDYLDGSHYDAKLSEQERTMVRLWIDTSATYPGTYASLGCGYYPVPLDPAVVGAVSQRCGSCHLREYKDEKGARAKRLQFGRYAGHQIGPLYNLSNPQESLILRAPLAKSAGGHELCKEAVFRGTDDPLYRAMLDRIGRAHDQLMAEKRFDMPGFRANEHYVREMQRFGILPADLAADAPIDVYAVDKAYWDSFDYRPSAE